MVPFRFVHASPCTASSVHVAFLELPDSYVQSRLLGHLAYCSHNFSLLVGPSALSLATQQYHMDHDRHGTPLRSLHDRGEYLAALRERAS